MMKELIFDLLGLVGVALSFLGILLNLYANRKIRASKLFSFDLVKIACKSISKKMKKNCEYPDIIIAQSPEAGRIGRLLVKELGIHIPIISGFKYETKNLQSIDLNLSCFNDLRYTYCLPKIPELNSSFKKVIIVDDRVRTGLFIQQCKNWLISDCHVRQENIKSVSLIVAKGLIIAKAAPDYYFLDSDDYYFPWD